MTRKSKALTVAFQGEKGAFSHEAALQLLGSGIEVAPRPRFEDMFRALAGGAVDAALAPMENTLHGSVHENFDHVMQFDLPVVAEIQIRIVHNLIVPPGVTWKNIRRVYSHPVALNQCLDFFARNPQFEKTSFYDTAGSVKMLMEEGQKDAAAIASAISAGIYGARILRRSIEDDRKNFTRFWLLRRPGAPPLELNQGDRKGWKTSLAFTTHNQPGSLFRALSAFALRDISLVKIESRPLRGRPWEYLFYVDILGEHADPKVQRALDHLREFADTLRVLGCYRA